VLPVQYLTTALSSLSTISGLSGGLYGPAVLFLLGALVAGSDWGRGTVTTALLAGPGRLASRLGQDLTVLTITAAGMMLTFVLAAGTAAGFALALGGTAPPADTRFPLAGHVIVAIAGGLLAAMACTAVGLALGTILRSATKAGAVLLLWSVLIIPYLDQIGGEVHGVLQQLYELLPDAAVNTVVNLYNPNTVNMEGTVQTPSGVLLTPALAFATLGLYVVACLAIAGFVTRRRSIA
jgi:ABC-2 type transport system permease protein